MSTKKKKKNVCKKNKRQHENAGFLFTCYLAAQGIEQEEVLKAATGVPPRKAPLETAWHGTQEVRAMHTGGHLILGHTHGVVHRSLE